MTKWLLGANVALLLAIVSRNFDAPQVLVALAVLSLFLGSLGATTILKTQCSLSARRRAQWKLRIHHRELARAERIAGETLGPTNYWSRCVQRLTPGHTSFWSDLLIWLPMFLIVAGSSLATAYTALCSRRGDDLHTAVSSLATAYTALCGG